MHVLDQFKYQTTN